MSAALDLEGELRRRRGGDGRYIAPELEPHRKPDTYALFAAALGEALGEAPDQAHAAEAAWHLIETFPGCRVGKAAYAMGLAHIVGDETIPPCVVRHACCRVRAEAKALPPLAERGEVVLRAMATGEASPDAAEAALAGLAGLARLRLVDELEARVRALEAKGAAHARPDETDRGAGSPEA